MAPMTNLQKNVAFYAFLNIETLYSTTAYTKRLIIPS